MSLSLENSRGAITEAIQKAILPLLSDDPQTSAAYWPIESMASKVVIAMFEDAIQSDVINLKQEVPSALDEATK